MKRRVRAARHKQTSSAAEGSGEPSPSFLVLPFLSFSFFSLGTNCSKMVSKFAVRAQGWRLHRERAVVLPLDNSNCSKTS